MGHLDIATTTLLCIALIAAAIICKAYFQASSRDLQERMRSQLIQDLSREETMRIELLVKVLARYANVSCIDLRSVQSIRRYPSPPPAPPTPPNPNPPSSENEK